MPLHAGLAERVKRDENSGQGSSNRAANAWQVDAVRSSPQSSHALPFVAVVALRCAPLTPSLAAVPGRSARTAGVVSAPRPSEVATGPSALSIYLSICPHWPMLRVALRRRRCRRERYDAAARRCADVARRPTGCQGRSSRCACSWGPAALSIVYPSTRPTGRCLCGQVSAPRQAVPCLAVLRRESCSSCSPTSSPVR